MDAHHEPCPPCGTLYPLTALSCPSCHALRHSEELKQLLDVAHRQSKEGQPDVERTTLERMLTLLPEDSKQYRQISTRLEGLAKPKSLDFRRWGALAGAAFLLWKFKWAFAFVFTKGKFLLLGLTKVKTLFSMLLALVAYWTIWGWPFALGFVLSIYVHEMGHVIALRRLGIAASAPMFIPFLGAFVRLKDYPKSPAQDAEVGLAGPIYGVAAAVACYALYFATQVPVLGGIAHAGAFINLFNLIPVWQLDGGRGFNALDKQQRFIMLGLITLGWVLSEENMFLLLLLGAGYRVFMTPAPEKQGTKALLTFGGLVLVLTALCRIRLPELDGLG